MENPGTFKYHKDTHPYLRSEIMGAGNNELSVALPIALYHYNLYHSYNGRIQEIGNVLGKFLAKGERQTNLNYTCMDTSVTKAIAQSDSILRESIYDFEAKANSYDLILSICQLQEHPSSIDPLAEAAVDRAKKLITFFEKKKDCLTEGGMALILQGCNTPMSDKYGNWVELVLERCKFLKTKSKNPAIRLSAREEANQWKPDRVGKLNRYGFGVAGNHWQQVELSAPDLPFYFDVRSTGTLYVLEWFNYSVKDAFGEYL
jgi:hypothetical protein